MSAHQLLSHMLPGPDQEDSGSAKWGCFRLLELMGETEGEILTYEMVIYIAETVVAW